MMAVDISRENALQAQLIGDRLLVLTSVPVSAAKGSKSSHKIRAVCLIIDNLPLFNSSYHHVVQRPWTIEPRMSRHIFSADSDPLCHLSS
jgi:hypothetical protein